MSDLWLRATARHEWALLPVEAPARAPGSAERARLYRRHFRWLRAERTAEFCPPSRAAEQLGWILQSPIDADLRPIVDIEVPVDSAERADLHELSLVGQVWVRRTSAIFTEGAGWLNYYQYRSGDQWHQMFVPNGQATLEWHLGLDLEVSDGSHLLILPAGPYSLTVPALLTAAAVRGQQTAQGFSIGICPTARVRVERGDPVARLIVLPDDTINAQLVTT